MCICICCKIGIFRKNSHHKKIVLSNRFFIVQKKIVTETIELRQKPAKGPTSKIGPDEKLGGLVDSARFGSFIFLNELSQHFSSCRAREPNEAKLLALNLH